MAKAVQLEIITPYEIFFKGEVELVIVRTPSGEEGFMSGHTWACKLLDIGVCRVQLPGETEMREAAVAGGYIDVKDRILIYTDAAVWAEDIDVERAQKKLADADEELEALGNPQFGENPDADIAYVRRAKAKSRLKLAEKIGKKVN